MVLKNKGEDGGTTSSLGEGEFAAGDCGSAGTGSTLAGVGSGEAASLGLTIEGRAPGHATCSRNCSIVIIGLW